MDLGIKGLRVVVTAGASGIGQEIARAFVEEGARVHICDVNETHVQQLREVSPEITASVCDVADRQSVAHFFGDIDAALGGIDCLVNNAGIAGPTGRVDELSPEEWDRTMAVNMTGQFNCVRLAVPHLLKSSNASIANLSSAAGRLGFPFRTPYAASKWAVIGFTKSLSMELGEFGIRVNAVLPGVVAGDRQETVLAAKAKARNIDIADMKRMALERASIKEMISPRQIADTVLCLASPRFRTTSGQALSVCGDLQSLS